MFALGLIFIRVITALFFIGIAGSAIVVAIAFVEDFRDLFDSDEPVEKVEHAAALSSAPSQSFAHSYNNPSRNLS